MNGEREGIWKEVIVALFEVYIDLNMERLRNAIENLSDSL
jgi:hypothetical protein